MSSLLPFLDHIKAAPADSGLVRMLVRRPASGEREILEEAELDLDAGVVGDSWIERGSSSTPDGRADPRAQVTVTSWRGMTVIASGNDVVALAGDQIYVDLDISEANLPAGTRLLMGSAVLEVTDKPHTGCGLFKARFGADALRFVNTGEGRRLRLRGINTMVVTPGSVRVGDRVVVERPPLGVPASGGSEADGVEPAGV
jgi:MOSC domain